MSPEQPSFNQITEQHDSGKRATVLVKRTSGEIQTGTYTGIRNEKGYHAVELSEKYESGDNKTRLTHVDSLTDEGQARLAEELAGESLRSAEASYEEYPLEHARRTINIKNDSNGQPERWMFSGEGVDGQGNEFFRLIRGFGDEFVTKDVTRNEMSQINAERDAEYNASHRVEAVMAHTAIEQVVAKPEAPALLEGEPDPRAKSRAELFREIEFGKEAKVAFGPLKDLADKLGGGTFDPRIMNSSIGREIDRLKAAAVTPGEKAFLDQLEAARVEGADNLTGSGKKIGRMISERFQPKE